MQFNGECIDRVPISLLCCASSEALSPFSAVFISSLGDSSICVACVRSFPACAWVFILEMLLCVLIMLPSFRCILNSAPSVYKLTKLASACTQLHIIYERTDVTDITRTNGVRGLGMCSGCPRLECKATMLFGAGYKKWKVGTPRLRWSTLIVKVVNDIR